TLGRSGLTSRSPDGRSIRHPNGLLREYDMQPFETACPHCTGTLRVSDPRLLGRKVKCPKCGERFQIHPPGENAEQPSAATVSAVSPPSTNGPLAAGASAWSPATSSSE